MKVTRGYCTDETQELKNPRPPVGKRFYFALHGGDLCDPVGVGTNWFSPPYPTQIKRKFYDKNILPFFSWRIGTHQGYLGYKPYGVDSPAYKDWLCDPKEVYAGSVALCLTANNGLTALPLLAIAGLLLWALL